MLYHNVAEMIGNTPLLCPEQYNRLYCPHARLLCKLESFEPAGSAKDRAALFMLNAAEAEGRLQAGATVIEPTSGNTGIGLAALCAARGYKLLLTMPETMSEERKRLLAAYGAELVLTDGKKGMNGAVEEAQRIHRETPGSIIVSQFDNPANPMAHYQTTGPEIWKDADGKVDVFVAGVGTGGTLSGVGRFLKEQNPSCKIVAVEPASSPLLSKGQSGAHGLQGIGANFVPKNFDRTVCDEILTVTEQQAFEKARALVAAEGILVGISSGAALHAATQLASLPEHKGKTVVVLLPDTGERYLSTALYRKENKEK